MNTNFISKKDRHKAQILNVGIDSTQKAELLSRVGDWVEEFKGGKRGKRLIFTPNPEMLVEAYDNQEFGRVLNSADINIPDGVGLQWASKWLARRNIIKVDQIISTRITGTDLATELVRLAGVNGWKVYLLGGETGVAEKALEKLERGIKNRHKNFKIMANSGPQHGMPSDEWREANEEVTEEINRFKPDLLFVAFGHKRQEMWLSENKEGLNFGVGMGVGGAFDFISGRVRRAPLFVRQIGLEWLFRLIQEPWRWRRQLKLIKFVNLVVKS